MRHISLFTGIGGFELAAQTVWGDEWEPVLFCEIDEFCQRVLKKHWPDVPIHSDIRDLNCEEYRGTVDLLTGGFPCQPYSVAGKQKGTGDDRALWPEMLRIIQEAKPVGIIGENVNGFVNMGLDDCVTDLEAEGYEVQPIIIPACAVGACHRRDRVWIIAHSKGMGRRDGTTKNIGKTERKEYAFGNNTARTASNVENTESERLERGSDGSNGKQKKSEQIFLAGSTFNEHWYEAATRLCRVDDGTSRGLDRTARLKALGNTIQWEVAAAIMQAIKESPKL